MDTSTKNVHPAQQTRRTFRCGSHGLSNQIQDQALCWMGASARSVADRCFFHSMDRSLRLLVSSFQHDCQVSRQDQTGPSTGSHHRSSVASTGLVSSTGRAHGGECDSDPQEHSTVPTLGPLTAASPARLVTAICSKTLRKISQKTGAQYELLEQLALSVRPSTMRGYTFSFKNWTRFCTSKNIDSLHPTVNDILAWLSSTTDMGTSPAQLTRYLSVLKYFFKLAGEKQPLQVIEDKCLRRFILGAFHSKLNIKKPTGPTWDPFELLHYWKTRPVLHLELPELARKTALLIMLASTCRIQALAGLNILHFTET